MDKCLIFSNLKLKFSNIWKISSHSFCDILELLFYIYFIIWTFYHEFEIFSHWNFQTSQNMDSQYSKYQNKKSKFI